MRPVSTLAGLLCYTDPVEQTREVEIGQLLTEETKRVLIDAAVMATDMQSEEGQSTMKLSQMIK